MCGSPKPPKPLPPPPEPKKPKPFKQRGDEDAVIADGPKKRKLLGTSSLTIPLQGGGGLNT